MPIIVHQVQYQWLTLCVRRNTKWAGLIALAYTFAFLQGLPHFSARYDPSGDVGGSLGTILDRKICAVDAAVAALINSGSCREESLMRCLTFTVAKYGVCSPYKAFIMTSRVLYLGITEPTFYHIIHRPKPL